MKFAVVGGAGAMGRITVRDLLESPGVKEVRVGDLNPASIAPLVEEFGQSLLKLQPLDVRQVPAVVEFAKGADVVVNCSQYYFNLEVMEACLQARVPYLDMGGLFHFTQKQLQLDARYREAGILGILGCGSTPGITNVFARYAADRLDSVESVEVKIGCADFSRSGASLAAPYSMDTILDEFTLNPMIFEEGEFREVPPFAGEQTAEFPPPVGPATAHYTLHSEVCTFPVSFKQKGIRRSSFRIAFPAAFVERLRFLVNLGLAGRESINLGNGTNVVPRELLLSLISKDEAQDGPPDDCDVIWVETRGQKDGKPQEFLMETIVRPHSRWKVSAGALDTGVPCSIIAQMMARGDIPERGVMPPETCVPPEPFFLELARREMHVTAHIKEEL